MILKSLLLAALSLTAHAYEKDQETGPAIREAQARGVLYKFENDSHEKVCDFAGSIPVFDWRQSQDVAIKTVGECASTLGGKAVNVRITAQVLIVEKADKKTFKNAHAVVTVTEPGSPRVNLQAYSAGGGSSDVEAKELAVQVNPTQVDNQEMFHASITVEDSI